MAYDVPIYVGEQQWRKTVSDRLGDTPRLSTLTTFTAGLIVSGTPFVDFPVGYGVTGNIWFSTRAIAQSATAPEVAGQSLILSDVGLAAGAEKVGFTSAAIGTTGTGPIVGHQAIGYGIGGAGGAPVWGERSSIANNGVDADAINTVSVYGHWVVSEGSARATGAYCIADPGLPNARFAYGMVIQGDVIGTAEWITFSSATILLQDNGSHTNGIDLSGGTYSGAPFKSVAFSVDNLGNVIPRVTTVAALGTPTLGARAMVTDATSTTFNDIVAGLGALVVPVNADGTNWKIG